MTVPVVPPDVTGARGTGEYAGEARSTNIIAASVEAYLAALNAMLAETHWEGAAESAVKSGRGRASARRSPPARLSAAGGAR